VASHVQEYTIDALDRRRPSPPEVLVAPFHQRMTRKVETAFGNELERARD
jgi:hypothetical protein